MNLQWSHIWAVAVVGAEEQMPVLADFLKDRGGRLEAMAVQVLQALEGFAKDPATEKLLPGETLTMMSNLQNWLWRQK